jgi:formyl-CoA transferase
MGVFRASDGYLNIAPLARMWRKFCDVLGDADIAKNPAFATRELRNENRPVLNAAIQEVIGRRERAHWVDAFNAVGVPCGPIYSVDETFADPQVRHLGIAKSVEVPALGRTELLGQPIHMSRAQHTIAAGTPEHGQHTDEILAEFGYDRDQIEGFRARRVV